MHRLKDRNGLFYKVSPFVVVYMQLEHHEVKTKTKKQNKKPNQNTTQERQSSKALSEENILWRKLRWI